MIRGVVMAESFVLLVEDNPDDVQLPMIAFKSAHFPYKIEVACDGAEALTFLRGRERENLPALILLDLNLPKINGLEVLERIRSDSRLSGLPVIVLTSSNREDERSRACKLGVLDYVLKPVDFSEFDGIVGKIKRKMEAVLHPTGH